MRLPFVGAVLNSCDPYGLRDRLPGVRSLEAACLLKPSLHNRLDSGLGPDPNSTYRVIKNQLSLNGFPWPAFLARLLSSQRPQFAPELGDVWRSE